MRFCTFVLGLFFVLLAAPCQAGTLFPPDNIGHNPNVACPNGRVLRWMGDRVDCADPTSGVNLTCPNGSVLQGISFGNPVCVALPTACASTSTSTSTSVSTSSTSSASASASAQATSSGTGGSTQSSSTKRSWN